ncbi:globin domain-containing protein [Roseibium sp. HPY-6]|uniref:globin domain-containing protein n=1 Tax=Roseibium sp. HPY-6 TaxID=3229852 RepID=UPI00338F6DE2
MSIAPEDLEHVRATRSAFAEHRDRTGALFYDLLFAENPELKSMFPSDLADQGRKLGATIAVAIDLANDWERLSPILENLARRHLGYGVEAKHYDAVGAALLATLSQAGATPEQSGAWARVYSKISGHMIGAAYPDLR